MNKLKVLDVFCIIMKAFGDGDLHCVGMGSFEYRIFVIGKLDVLISRCVAP